MKVEEKEFIRCFFIFYFFLLLVGFSLKSERAVSNPYNAVFSNRIEMLLQQKPLVTKQVFFFCLA